jgi:DNA-binding transcriptional LysR family regulator
MIVRPPDKTVELGDVRMERPALPAGRAREGSTLSAAKALGVSQPTVQRRLAALEERIGLKLVEHHPTGYRLTELGKAIFPHAVDVERAVESFQRQLLSAGEELRVRCG